MNPVGILALGLTIAAPQHVTCPRDRVSAAAWAAQQAHTIQSGDFDEDVLREVSNRLDQCRDSLAQIPGGSACLDPLSRFTRAQLLEYQDDHQLGADQTDATFLSSAPYPEMLQLPEELRENDFLQLLDRNDRPSLDAAQAKIAQVNAGITDVTQQWKVFEYVSQHLYTPDGTKTLGRFFVYVPGKDFDRYLQFGLQDDPAHAIPNSVSIVAVQKTDPRTHTSLFIPEARLIDLWRLRKSNGSYDITTRYAVTHQVENCYGCHKSAVLPVTPDPKTFDSARYSKTVSFVNKQMARYGHVQMAGQDMEGYGPGIGPETFATRTDAFLAKCAHGLVAPGRFQRVKDLMTCTRCHDGDTRGTLNFPSGRRTAPPNNLSLVEDYVVNHRKMPPGADDLTATERKGLFRCLLAEYYDGDGTHPGVLESWLAAPDCWAK